MYLSGDIPAVRIVAETRMLEGMLSFRAVDEGLRRLIEVDSIFPDDLGVGRFLGKHLIGGVELWRSQDVTL